MASTYRNLEFVKSMRKSAKVLVPISDIKFLHKTNKDQTFGIRSPLTNEWHTFNISNEFVQANCVPQDVQDFVDYYEDTRTLLEHCRSHTDLCKDLQCLDEEEARIFGLRSPALKRKARFA